MTITIRRAHSQDTPMLNELVLRSKQSNGYDDDFMAACADELRVTLEQIAQNHFWLAEDEALSGCVCLSMNDKDNEGTMKSFFIAPEARRQGIGRALWQVVLQAAQEHNLTRLTLDADPAAVPFYEAMGFATYREVPSGSIAGRMLPQMERLLP